MTHNRSYYTTPLFVCTALIGLFVLVKNHNIQQDVTGIYNSYLRQSLHTNTLQARALQKERLSQQVDHLKTPDQIRSIYMSSWVASSQKLRNKLIQFIEDSELNAIIIDIKDSTGVISFSIQDPVVERYYDSGVRIRDIEDLISKLHEKDIYVIGRLTTFQDSALAKKHPELALNRLDNGNTWTDRKGLAFINPQKRKSWEYLVAIAQASYNLGFDEINFDYIRYPSDGNISNIDYDLEKGDTRRTVLKEFYQYLDNELRKKRKIPISADIFGLVTTAKDDIGIGQYFEDIYPYFDAIAPMVYPSHYSNGFFGYQNPNAHPYEVIQSSMGQAVTRAKNINEDPGKLRTWIQDFSLGGITYTEQHIREQIAATYKVGLDSYMAWDPKNKYTKSAYYNN